MEDLSWRGLAETLVIPLTVFTVWSFTTYESTMALAGGKNLGRWTILATMALGLVMNASIPSVFGASPWAFVVPLLIIQIGRILVTRRLDADPHLAGHRLNMAVWAAGSGVQWVLRALVESETRLWWWLAATSLDVLGTVVRHPLPGRHTGAEVARGFDVPHQVERSQLFLIICLGEAILTTGSGLIPHPQHAGHLLVARVSMGVIVSIWFLFYGIRGAGADEALERRGDDLRPGQLATQGQQVLVPGLVGFAVGNGLISQPAPQPVGGWTVTVMHGGIVLCIQAFWAYLGAVTGRWNACTSLLVGAGTLVVVGALTWVLHLPGWACLGVMFVLMVLVCVGHARDTRQLNAEQSA